MIEVIEVILVSAMVFALVVMFLAWLIDIGVRHKYRRNAPTLDEWKQQHRSKIRRRK